MKRKNCKFCGKYSAKRDVCLECKEKYAFVASGESGRPFVREDIYIKDLKRK